MIYSNFQIGHNKARRIFFGLYIIFFTLITTMSSQAFTHKKNDKSEITEDLYSKMNDKHFDVAAENLLIALESKANDEKHKWIQGSYQGYIVPFSTYINELGYFCRDYVEVIIRNGSRYNVYENNACRDHDGEWVWISTKSANRSERLN